MSQKAYPPLNTLEDGFIRREHFRSLLGYPSVATFYEWMSRGIIPRPVKCGPRTIMWPVEQVRETLDKIKAGQLEARNDE